ncbi:MAG: hypothetical protein WBF53_11665 [Litorimonas sp.]
MTFPKALSLFAATLLFASPALAQSPERGDGSEPAETAGEIVDRILRESRLRGEDLAERGREAAEEAGEALERSDLVGNMSELMTDFADRLEVERGEGEGTALFFDGDELLRIRRELKRQSDDRITITGLGRNLSVERETTTRDGRTTSRIVIEMEGGEDLEVELPRVPDDASDQE